MSLMKRALEGTFDFDGKTYEPQHDKVRLNRQLSIVWNVMKAGHWMTLARLASLTKQPEASVSARLRDLRKDRFGSHTVERRRRGAASDGLWEYRLIPSQAEVEVKQ